MEHYIAFVVGFVVSKRVGLIYRSGASAGDWAKTLNPAYLRTIG